MEWEDFAAAYAKEGNIAARGREGPRLCGINNVFRTQQHPFLGAVSWVCLTG